MAEEVSLQKKIPGVAGLPGTRSAVEKSKSVGRKMENIQFVMKTKISSKWKVAAKVRAVK